MAFATSNVLYDVQGSHKVVTGTWTGTAGDAAGTFTVAGGKIFKADFGISDSSGGPSQVQCPVQTSLSGYLTTVTVNYGRTVTTGTFKIEFA